MRLPKFFQLRHPEQDVPDASAGSPEQEDSLAQSLGAGLGASSSATQKSSLRSGKKRGVRSAEVEPLTDEQMAGRTKEAFAQHDPALLPSWFTSPRPPRWLSRALATTIFAIFLGIFVWRAMGSVTGVFTNVVIAVFLALAMEPMILWLVKHRWKRGAATISVLIGMLLVTLLVFALFGKMFVEQSSQLIASLPDVYASVADWLKAKFDVHIPEMNDLQKQLVNEYGQDAATQVIAIGAGVASFLFNASVVLLVAYYLAAAGPKFRATVCAFVTPNRQSEFLKLWEITQTKIADYINSRVVLAAFSSVATYLFLEFAVDVPYALPLAVFTGVTSQFVPTIGTYIGGALPIIFALTAGQVYGAIWILAFVIAYQQFENLWLSPKISSRALSLNPAVAFLVVLSFGAIFGALGAFLALPVAATIQAIGSTYLRRHELVDSELLRDPEVAARNDGSEESDLL